MERPLRVLFSGWTLVPHSYACVNCFQIVHLYKNYREKVEIFIEEMPYFQAHWNNAKKQVYSEEYDSILKSLKKYNGEDVDVVYSITYPYNIKTSGNVKRCVFYTSEFSKLDSKYFMLGNGKSCEGMGEDFIKGYVNDSENNLWFTSPSEWSSEGMRGYGVSDSRNRVITHGVDTATFKRDSTNRDKVRAFYKVEESDTLILNVGAMTQNKGIMLLLESLNVIVNRMGDTSFKLLLKGTGDLYQSKNFLELYFEDFQRRNVMSKSEVDTLLQNHIIFTDKTLSYAKINDLYNACDVYVCPYLAEGFGLVPLECLSSGCKVIVPRTGSTKEYIDDIYSRGGKDFIMYVNSEVHTFQGGLKQNVIDVRELTEVIIKNKGNYKSKSTDGYKEMRMYIESAYSWNRVSRLLFDYLKTIVSTNVKDCQGA
jgi:glycosyltransferase involved in cell wall biosynthesis